jgi:hypothetical protein
MGNSAGCFENHVCENLFSPAKSGIMAPRFRNSLRIVASNMMVEILYDETKNDSRRFAKDR